MTVIPILIAFTVVVALGYGTAVVVRRRRTDRLATGHAIMYIAAAFAFILGLTLSTAAGHYSDARSTAQSEAAITSAMIGTAIGLPDAEEAKVQNDLVCIMESTIHDEWPMLLAGNDRGSQRTNDYVQSLYDDIAALSSSDRQASALAGQMATRAQLRDQRLLDGEPRVPVAIWVVLLVMAYCVVLFIGLHDDYPTRRMWVFLSLLLVISILTSTAVLAMLDNPYTRTPGPTGGLAIGPTAMQRTVDMLADYGARTGQPLACRS